VSSKVPQLPLGNYLDQSLTDFIHVLSQIPTSCKTDLEVAVATLTKSCKNGGRILICGNGGSAADSQHFAGELVATFRRGLERPGISALALSNDIATLTALANDFSYEDVYSRQVEAHGRKGDCLICISTSGNSENVLRAASRAKSLDLNVISITGNMGARLSQASDISIIVPSSDTQVIQNTYQFLLHVICYGIEESMFADA
jgi:D-sedoheptulose 7-phosphate isomerase